ncbi:MAG: serine protease [Myxococcota bacterium]
MVPPFGALEFPEYLLDGPANLAGAVAYDAGTRFFILGRLSTTLRMSSRRRGEPSSLKPLPPMSETLNLKRAPPGGFIFAAPSYLGSQILKQPLDAIANHRDFALIPFVPSPENTAITRLRATADVKNNEPLWVIGDVSKTDATCVSVGYMGQKNGDNAIMHLPTEPGFSGSPVLDRDGYLVGMVVAMDANDSTKTLIATSEALLEFSTKQRLIAQAGRPCFSKDSETQKGF